MNSADSLLRFLRSLADDSFRAGLARFGLDPGRALGVPMPAVRRLAAPHRGDVPLARELWERGRGVLEARLLACVVAGPALSDPADLERWAADLDSWWLTDTFCNEIVRRLPDAPDFTRRWSSRPEEYVARAAFAVAALLAQHDRSLPDAPFVEFLSLAERGAAHPALYARKGADWAVRQIAKRNPALFGEALRTARRLASSGEPRVRSVGLSVLSRLRRAPFRRPEID